MFLERIEMKNIIWANGHVNFSISSFANRADQADILTLKLQGFNKHMLQLLMKIHEAIGTILRELNEDNALILADKLIKYVSNNAVLDNLSFLIDKHLEGKKVDFIPHQLLGVAQVNGLKKLKELIGYLKANI